ncbi:MAG: leucine-rich repeat protein [Oscillospiraceae bacterium]|nr:leucine-rich repeat protein [Oscillospiraceae bacterium]
MNLKSMLTTITAAMICLTGTPLIPALADISMMTASAEDELTYGELTYKVIGDTVTISCCDKSAVTVDIPAKIDGKSVTTIGLSAFADCTSLTTVTIPESVTMIGMGAFAGCTSLQSITVPKSVTVLSTSVFSGCTSLKTAVIQANITYLGASVFSDCTSLRSISLPESVTSVGISAFSGCTNLTSIWIPKGMTKVIMNAFSGTFLTDIYYAGTEAQWKKVDVDNNNDPFTTATVHFNAAALPEPDLLLGDVNGDDAINASDAAVVLITAAQIGAGDAVDLTDKQKSAADVNKDSKINASDAAVILMYAAAVGAGDKDVKIEDFITSTQ